MHKNVTEKDEWALLDPAWDPTIPSIAGRDESISARAHVIDLCCGLGGLSHAATSLGMKVVAGVDSDTNALRTFKKNFPDAEAISGSVKSIKILQRCETLFASFHHPTSPRIILSGPPCQGFSMAGPRDPKDLRNRVLTAVARAITILKPDCALIENVSTVLSEKHDARLKKLEAVLTACNYSVLRLVLDASRFGVPQKRKRAFFLVTKKDLNKSEVMQVISTYEHSAEKVQSVLSGLPTPTVRPDDYEDERDYGCIPNHFAMRHSPHVIQKIAKIEPGTGPMSYRKLHPTRFSNTLFPAIELPQLTSVSHVALPYEKLRDCRDSRTVSVSTDRFRTR